MRSSRYRRMLSPYAFFLGICSGVLVGGPAVAQPAEAQPEPHKDTESGQGAGAAAPKEEAQEKEAQADQAEAAAVDRKEKAKKAYLEGKEAFLVLDYETALERFQVSHENSPSPNSRLMKARALNLLGRRPEALYEFRQTAREAEQSGENRYRASGRTAIREAHKLEKELGAITVNVQFERVAAGEQAEAEEQAGAEAQKAGTGEQAEARLQGAVLTVGGLRIERDRWSEPIPVEPGLVSVQVQAVDGQGDAQEVEVKVGEVAEVALKIPAPLSEPTPEPEPEPVAPVRVEIDSDDAGLRLAGLLAGGVGLVGMAVFVGCGVASNAKLDDLERACPGRTDCDPALRDDADTGDTLQTAANVGLVVGALGIAAGVTLYVLGSMDEQSSVALGPGSIWIRGEL